MSSTQPEIFHQDSEREALKNVSIRDLCLQCCKGNTQAIEFCDHWFHYCHSIDDLIDTQINGAITMTPEAILKIFVQANLLYNSVFYRTFHSALQPVVLLVTNAYADSVEWEKSDVNRRSTMADVLRCCGNDMFFAVAMICGGWDHARSVSAKIRDASWIYQHDENDKPN